MTFPRGTAVTATVAMLASAVIISQTRVVPPKNSYKPSDDVQLGRDAATQAEEQLPVMQDAAVTSYVEGIGRRLVAAIPPELQHPEFSYSFKVVNVREINAFALPGGPMFVNRGMIESANDEGEIAGVMSHELSHVVLRHGTAQASKAKRYEVGELAGAVLGAVIGGTLGRAVSGVTQFGLGAAFLRFSREYEQQADLEGAQIMARAGYDPRDMANMFKTIEEQSGPGGPQWLSDHPNPGNRYEYIRREADTLRVQNPVRQSAAFAEVRTHLKSLPPAPTTEEAAKAARSRGAGGASTPPRGGVEAPSSRFATYTEGTIFRVSVPANWRELATRSAVTFAPDGAHGTVRGHRVFTHGVEIGIARTGTQDLETATTELLDALASGNPQMSRPATYSRTTVGGRPALQTTLSNISEATRQPETIQIVTALMSSGNLLYVICVAPRDAFDDYQPSFDRVVRSIQLLGT